MRCFTYNICYVFCRDFMDKSMDRTKHMLYYLYPILGKAQPEVREYMERYRTESTQIWMSLLIRHFSDVSVQKLLYLSHCHTIFQYFNLNMSIHRAEVGTIFCLSWLITWYGHVLSDFRSIVRLYDYFIACHQLMPIYMAAAVSNNTWFIVEYFSFHFLNQ